MIQLRTVGSSGVIGSASDSSQSRISCAVVREARRALAFISGVVMGDGYFLFRMENVLAVYAFGLAISALRIYNGGGRGKAPGSPLWVGGQRL